MMRLLVHTVALAVACISVSSCGRPSGPSRAEIESYLQERLPETLNISNLKVEHFMGEDGSSGRISCAGSLTLNEDLYQDGWNAFAVDLKAAVGNTYEAHIGEYRRVRVYQLAYTKGTEIPFTAEIYVRRIVEGWEFDGYPKYKSHEGTQRSSFSPGGIVVGEPDYEAAVTRVVETKQRYDSIKADFMRRMESFFSPKEEIGLYRGWPSDKSGPTQFVAIRINGDIGWDPEGLDARTFVVPGSGTFVKDQRVDGWHDFKAGQTNPVRIYGTIGMLNGEWSANITSLRIHGVLGSNAKAWADKDGFVGTHAAAQWKGDQFAGPGIVIRQSRQ